ncbi:uncharacterized protein LOC141644324 isoform X2 [Silene latifolia]|uniref:uncharacterized protein LOC141644324 isoform X2 n=1 Tax=Silene latifolia TaxID=37657 RepID=UPI003D7739BF
MQIHYIKDAKTEVGINKQDRGDILALIPNPVYVNESFRQMNAASIESDPDPCCLEQIELAVLHENTPAFVELINNSPSHFLDEELFDSIWPSLFLWDSGKCLAAILDGQTQLTKLPHLAPSVRSKLDNCPLHYAAASAAYKITTLLLQRGFSADVRCDPHDFTTQASVRKLKNVLPLHLVMARLRDLTMFVLRGKLSAVMLVLTLSSLSSRYSLETLRLMAQNTTEVKREFFNYLKEGKMIEVGALLLVAKSQILSPSTTAKREGEFRSMSEMHDFVLNTKNNKLVQMKEMLVLLEIFDKIGDELAALLRLDISKIRRGDCSMLLAESLIEDAGFDVKHIEPDHPCTRGELLPYFLKRAIDECGKTVRTSDMLPSWVTLRGLREKSGTTSRLTNPSLGEALPYVNCVTPGSASHPMLQNMAPLYHIIKKTAPVLGTIKRMFRR